MTFIRILLHDSRYQLLFVELLHLTSNYLEGNKPPFSFVQVYTPISSVIAIAYAKLIPFNPVVKRKTIKDHAVRIFITLHII